MTRAEIAADFCDWSRARLPLAPGQAVCREYRMDEPAVGWEQVEWRPWMELLQDAGHETVNMYLGGGRLILFVGLPDVAADAPALVEAR
jgi:hypothetical protein